MKLYGRVNWIKIGRLVVLFNLLLHFSNAFSQNLPPVLDRGIPSQHAEVGSLYAYVFSTSAFRDENIGDQLTYSAQAVSPSSWPAWLNFDPSTRRFSGTPTSSGTYQIRVTAVDQSLESAHALFTLTVHSSGVDYAAFTMDVQMGCGTRYVQFENKSKITGSMLCRWDFGNGNTSVVANPVANYTRPGTYTVTLTINDNPSLRWTEVITIFPNPSPEITRFPLNNGCEPYAIQLTSSGIATGGTEKYYNWYSEQFPDQYSYYTTSKSLNLNNLTNNNYTVDLTITDANGCVGTKKFQHLFEVYDIPVDTFTYTRENSCSPSATTFTRITNLQGSQVSTVVWNVNGEVFTNPTEPFIYTFTAPGSYPVTLTTTSEHGCVSSGNTQIIRFNTNNSADFSFSPDPTCFGTATQFSAVVSPSGAITGYEWDFNNDGITDATTSNPEWSFPNAGANDVKFSASFNDGCVIDVSKQVNVLQLNADFDHTYTGTCSGLLTLSLTDRSTPSASISTRRWYYRRMGQPWNSSVQTNPTIPNLDPGNYDISLVVTNSTGCKDSISRNISLSASNVTGITITGGEAFGCFPASQNSFRANFSSDYESALFYDWDFNNNGTYELTTGSNTASYTYPAPENYSVRVRVRTNNGCEYVGVLNHAVQLALKPVFDPEAVTLHQTDYCYSTGIQLEIDYPDNTDSLQIITSDTIIYIPNPGIPNHWHTHYFPNIGMQSIQVVAIERGCPSDPFVLSNIQIDGPKTAFTTSGASYFCNELNVQFVNQTINNAGATTNYSWNFGDLQGSTEVSPSHNYTQAGNYSVNLTATDANTGCTSSTFKAISLFEFSGTDDIILPDIPDGCSPIIVTFGLDMTKFSSNFEAESYTWNFKDGTPLLVTTSPNAEHLFSAPGSYNVSVTVTGKGNSCEFTSTMATPFISRGPIAGFTHSPASVCSGNVVNFTNASYNLSGDTGIPVSFNWDFGDGTTPSTVGIPGNTTHTYSKDSIFSVTLKVTDSNGCSDSITKVNLIDIKPFTALYEVNQRSCNGTQVVFRNLSTGENLQFRWDFNNDETTDLTTFNTNDVSHTYPTAGNYTAKLTVIAPGGCEKTYTHNISVSNISANFSALDQNIGCAPSVAYFTPTALGSDVVRYFWNFGDGITTYETAPQHKYYTPGEYDVTLQVLFSNGCEIQHVKEKYITVDGAYGELAYDATPKCNPNEVIFTLNNLSSVDSITWDYGDGIGSSYRVEGSPTSLQSTYSYTKSGFARPSVVLSSDLCAQSYTYEKFTFGESNPIEIYTSVPPIAAFTTDRSEICQGVPIQFTDTSIETDTVYPASSWKWIFASTHSVSDTSHVQYPPSYAYQIAGGFTPKLIVSNEMGCSDSVTASVLIFNKDNNNTSFSATDYLVCPNQNITFTGVAASTNGQIISYFWDFDDGYSATTRNSTHAFDQSQRGLKKNVLFVATDDKLCSDSTFRAVDVNNLQAVPGYSPQPVYRDRPVDFFDNSTSDFGTSVLQRTWTFASANPGTSNLADQLGVLFPTIGNNFNVTLRVRNDNGCEDEATIQIDVLNNPPVVSPFTVQFFKGINYTFKPDSFVVHFDPLDPLQVLTEIQVVSLPSIGLLYHNGSLVSVGQLIPASQLNLLRYHPPADWNDTTSFVWNGSDGTDYALIPAQITIVVLPEPDPPTPLNIIIQVAENEVAEIRYTDFVDHFVNPSIPDLVLDSVEIITLPSSPNVRLTYNGSNVSVPMKLSKAELLNSIFRVELINTYNEGNVSFLWNGFDSLKWGINPAQVIIQYINAKPELNDIVRDNLKEDAIQTVGKNEFLLNYSDADLHDNPTMFFLNIPDNTPGTFRINGNPVSSGLRSISFNIFTSITYTPRAGGNDTVNVNWGASDGQDTTFALLRFSFINTPPVALDLNLSGIEDTRFDFLTTHFSNRPAPFYDIDVYDVLKRIQIESLPEHATLRYIPPFESETTISTLPFSIEDIHINNRLRLYPDPDWYGTTSFTYRSFDGTEWSEDSATVWITFAPVNDAPRPVDDYFEMDEDEILTGISVRANDFDVDDERETLTVTIDNAGTAGDNGIIILELDGGLSYAPYHNFNGSVSFRYRICDPQGACSTAMVTIVVHPVNDPPTAVNDTIEINEDVSLFVSDAGTNLLFNDSDPENDPIRLVQAGGVAPGQNLTGIYGYAIIQNDGSYTYSPIQEIVVKLDLNEVVVDSFQYIVADIPDSLTSSAWLFVRIKGKNSPPVAVNDTIYIDEKQTTQWGEFSTLLANDSDPENNPLQVININGNPNSPYESIEFGTLDWNSQGEYSYSQVFDRVQKFTYLREGQTGIAEFTYTITDIHNAVSSAKLVVVINGKNDPPVAVNDTLTFPFGEESVYKPNNQPGSMLFNDYDPDYADPFWVVKINDSELTTTTTRVGTLIWSQAGDYTYIPNQDSVIKLQEGEFARDIFTYIIRDELGATDTATLTITIWGGNDNPISQDDYLWIMEDDYVTHVTAEEGLLSNDGDPENDPIVVAINNESSGSIKGNYGTLYWEASGAFTYMSDTTVVDRFPKDSVFTDVFEYRIIDTRGAESFSHLFVYITGENDAPFAFNHYESIREKDPPLERTEVNKGILSLDYDVDMNDILRIITINESENQQTEGIFGLLEWNPNGTFTYTLNPETDSLYRGEEVVDTFRYVIEDLHDSTANALLIIYITGENDAPVAVNDTISLSEDVLTQEFKKAEESLLFNDYDVDGDPFHIITVNSIPSKTIQSKYCRIEWDSTGYFTYFRNAELDTLPLGITVIDSIRYTISDPDNSTSTAWLLIYIIGENDAPVAVRDEVSILETTEIYTSTPETNLLFNDWDYDSGDTLTTYTVLDTIVSPAIGTYGILLWEQDGSFTYHNNPEATDSLREGEIVFDIFPYQVRDIHFATGTDTLWIKITGVNDVPVAMNDTIWMKEDDPSVTLTSGIDGLLENDYDVDGEELIIVNFANSALNTFETKYGTITFDSKGSIYFETNIDAVDSLKHGEIVNEVFMYVISDPQNSTDTAYLYIYIEGENDNPVAVNDLVTIDEDTEWVDSTNEGSFSVLDNDYDIDGDAFFVTTVNGETIPIATQRYGELHWDSTGAFIFYTYREITDSLAFGDTVYVDFEYVITDINGGTSTAVLQIEIIGVNDPPKANANFYSTLDIVPIIVAETDENSILYNDEDVDSEVKVLIEVNNSPLTVAQGNFGVLTWNSDGTFEYKPDSAFAVSLRPLETVIDTFLYKMEDDWQASDTSLLHFSIEGINNAPIARNDTLTVYEDEIRKQLLPPGLLIDKNVHDPDRDTLRVTLMQGSTNNFISGTYGILEWDSTGMVAYMPDQNIIHKLGPGSFITEKFRYTIIDEGGLTAQADIVVIVLGMNDPVTAYNDTITIEEDSYGRKNVVENDYDPDNWEEGNFDYASLTIITGPKHGNASRNSSNGEIYYFPEKDFFGKDSLQYRICDEGSPVYCDNAWLHINVLPVNDPPVASHLVLETPFQTAVSFEYALQVTDIDDGINPASLAYPSNNPKLSLLDEFLTYTPEAEFSGIDEFIYSMKDNSGVAAYVVVTVIVGDTLSDFKAQNDTISTLEDTPIEIYVLENDTLGFEMPDPRTVEIKTFPINGTAIFDLSKQFIFYAPDSNFYGTDSLVYIVSSGPGVFSSAKVIITVIPVPDQITAKDDIAETEVNNPVTVAVLTNDIDPDGIIDVSTLSVITFPENGSLTINNISGTLTYTPLPNFYGIDSLWYRICNNDNDNPICDSARVFILVKQEMNPFIAKNDNYTTDKNTPKELVNPAPYDNDKNLIDGLSADPLTFEVANNPLNGRYVLSNSIITYTPQADYYGPDWITYIVADTDGNYDMAEINIWINESNMPPIAANDTFMVTKNEFKRLFILENDSDPDGYLNYSTLTTVASSGPRNGEIQIDTNTGTILYKPTINSGDDWFTYRICDNRGACTQATVYITIELDTTIYIYRTIDEDTPVTIDLTAEMNRYNFNFTIAQISEEQAPELGSYQFGNNNKELTYTPGQDLNGNDAFRLNVCSAENQCAYLRIFIRIRPVNDAPVAIKDTLHWHDAPDTFEGTFSLILDNDYDVDGDQLLLTNRIIEKGFDELNVSFNFSDSTLTITADTIYWCDAWFVYEIKDEGGLSDTAMVSIWPKLTGIEAIEDYFEVYENIPSNVFDVAANDILVYRQRCTVDTIKIIIAPQNGQAVTNADNNIEYTPTRHYYGPDSLLYEVVDIWGQTSRAWVYIEVIQRNMPPVAEPDVVESDFGKTIVINVLDNDYDPDALDLPGSPGDPNAFIDSARTVLSIGSYPLYGSVVFDPATFSFVYTHNLEGCDDDFFEYTIFDNEGDSASAKVTIILPDLAQLFLITDSASTYPGVMVEVEPLANDSGYFIPQIIGHTSPMFGYVKVVNNIVSYTPNLDFIGRDSMLYTVTSECGNQSSAYIIFIVEELRVPQIITPNNDGKNDVLIIDGIEYFPDNLFQIYNRYGHIVYEKKRYDNSWGGNSNKGSLGGNKPLPSGTYYYTLIYNEGRNRQAGFIYIFR